MTEFTRPADGLGDEVPVLIGHMSMKLPVQALVTVARISNLRRDTVQKLRTACDRMAVNDPARKDVAEALLALMSFNEAHEWLEQEKKVKE